MRRPDAASPTPATAKAAAARKRTAEATGERPAKRRDVVARPKSQDDMDVRFLQLRVPSSELRAYYKTKSNTTAMPDICSTVNFSGWTSSRGPSPRTTRMCALHGFEIQSSCHLMMHAEDVIDHGG